MCKCTKKKPTWEIKDIEKEIDDTKNKNIVPVTALDLLEDSVVESSFPNI